MLNLGNQGIRKLLFLILIMFSYVSADDVEVFSYVPSVKALVSDTQIVAGHMVELKIRANGDKVEFPNIEEINGVQVLDLDKIVVNRPHYINGVMKKERTILILTFAPHHDVVIPAYQVKIDGRTYKTKAIKIKVIPMSAQNKEDGNAFFLSLETDKKSVVEGESFLVTVQLSLKLGLRLARKPHYIQPEFKGFFAQNIDKERVYTEGNRQITEYKYLLTPIEAGKFKVGTAKAKISVIDKNRQDMFGRFKGITVPIASNRVNIEVKKKLQESDLVGDFKIVHKIDKKKVSPNKPVTLTVTIVGEGILDDFVFPEYEIEGVTLYSEDAKTNVELNGSVLHGTYSQRFSFISDHDFVIPARRISVYNTTTQTVNYLEVPSYAVHVKGSKAVTIQKAEHLKVDTLLDTPQHSMLDIKEVKKKVLVLHSPAWWMMALAFILGLLAMYMLYYLMAFRWQKKTKSMNEEEALNVLYGHMGEDEEVEKMVRQLYAKTKGDNSIVVNHENLKKLVEKYV